MFKQENLEKFTSRPLCQGSTLWSEKPFRLYADGRIWRVATNTHTLVAVAERSSDKTEPINLPPETPVSVIDILRFSVTQRVLVAELQRSCGPAEWPKFEDCTLCNGRGAYHCNECERDGECPQCDGERKEWTEPESRRGMFKDLGFNMNHIARVLESIELEDVVSIGIFSSSRARPANLLGLQGCGWRAVFSPMGVKEGAPVIAIATEPTAS